MTTSPPSSFDPIGGDASNVRSSAFERLHVGVQRWIWNKQWRDLRDVQERAVVPILEAKRDVLLSASTAAGKTEAAFLPICSRLADDPSASVRALYVGPLKALINDQFERLEDLCAELRIDVHRWHGDIAASKKKSVIEEPSGILLITPESLEALFVRIGHRIARVFSGLEHVVLDEVHAYIGTERGRQVQSLLHRMELVLRRRVQRIGLSATLGDLGEAASYMRPGDPSRVECIVAANSGQELKVQVRGYRGPVETKRQHLDAPDGVDASDGEVDSDVLAIAEDLYRTLRGGKHLVFANSRKNVELYADRLRRRCEAERVPNEFVPHHGSLSKELREAAEEALKDKERPTTAVCTSTLELGIDIGQVASVAQIGAPFSVASLRQRLGRSGRRGAPAILRMYVSEPELDSRSKLIDELRAELVQAVAAIELLIRGWCEPHGESGLHLSVLVQQVLSVIAQHGGVRAKDAWRALCESGPFHGVDERLFAMLLRDLGAKDLIAQSPDGTLVLGSKGEKIVDHYSFYAVFSTPEEFRIAHGPNFLGSMAFDLTLVVGLHIVFGGRRWRIMDIDPVAKLLQVAPAPGGRLPHFEGGRGGLVHDRVRQEMRRVYESSELYAYLDRNAAQLLSEARASYARNALDETSLVQVGGDTLVFACRGDRVLNTLAVELASRKLSVEVRGPVIVIDRIAPEDARRLFVELSARGPANPLKLAQSAANKATAKYDWAIGDELLCIDYAQRALDVDLAQEVVRGLSAPLHAG